MLGELQSLTGDKAVASEAIEVYFDGGTYISNPGAAAGGAVLYLPAPIGGTVTTSKFLPNATNNEAEYTGLIAGLQKALELEYQNVAVFGDSDLVVKQLNGLYRVKQPHLKLLWEQAIALKQQFSICSIAWVPRAQNVAADAVATQAIQEALGFQPVKLEVTALPTCPPASGLEAKIAELIQQGTGAAFKLFVGLKVPGSRDRFTAMSYVELQQRVATDVQVAIAEAIGADVKLQARVMRWYLRGLPVPIAVCKVQVDMGAFAKRGKGK